MADALSPQEADLLDLGDPGPLTRHRLLKAGHHGSRNTSSPEWLAALQPELALISAGRRNRFDHPDPGTVQALREAGVPLWVTGATLGVRAAAVPGGWRIDRGDGAGSFTPLGAIRTPAGPPPGDGSPPHGWPATGTQPLAPPR